MAARQRLTIAIMPTQYYSADAQSADNVTQGLMARFERQGYSVVPLDRSQSVAESTGYQPSRPYADQVAVRFGRRLGADLVAYPRLLALGLPAAAGMPSEGLIPPAAVVHLRVLNTHTGKVVYFRQVAHEYTAERPIASEFYLPRMVADAAAQEVTQRYFVRVAGSRQEIGRAR